MGILALQGGEDVNTPDLEFESVDSHDPLSILHDTLEGLERVSGRVWGNSSDPILSTVTDCGFTENQGESLAVHGGDESDSADTTHVERLYRLTALLSTNESGTRSSATVKAPAAVVRVTRTDSPPWRAVPIIS